MMMNTLFCMFLSIIVYVPTYIVYLQVDWFRIHSDTLPSGYSGHFVWIGRCGRVSEISEVFMYQRYNIARAFDDINALLSACVFVIIGIKITRNCARKASMLVMEIYILVDCAQCTITYINCIHIIIL